MYIRLIRFINENGLLYKYQFGFQKGKSTSDFDRITEALGKGECIIGAFSTFPMLLIQLIIVYHYKTGITWYTRYHTQVV